MSPDIKINPDHHPLPPGVWDNPLPEDAAVFAEFVEAYLADDTEYQKRYNKWLHSDDDQNVRSLAYGADCTNAHQNCPQDACIDSDLVALYEFDSVGDPWKDNAGSYDLTSDYPPGLSGFGMVGSDMPDFDGGDWPTGEYLNNTDVPLTSKEDFTVCLWLQGTTAPAEFTLIVGGHKWDLVYDPYNSRYRFSVGHGVDTVFVNTDSVAPISLNTSRFIVLRKDADHISIWMKWNGGESFDCVTHLDNTAYVENDGFGISDLVTFSGSGPSIDRYMGYIDEIALWQRCLSNTETEWLWGVGVQGGGRLLSTWFCGGIVLLGGTASVSSNQSKSADGGIRLSGQAVFPVYEVGEGGLTVSGAAIESRSFNPVLSGGAVVDGEALVEQFLTMFGGITCGGSADLGYTAMEIMTGGVVVSHGLFANGFAYRRPFRHPAGEITNDIDKFPLFVSALAGDGVNYLVTSYDGTTETIVAHEVVLYTSGRVHIVVKTPLHADTPTDHYLYYG